jgi:ATP-dependent Lon protease
MEQTSEKTLEQKMMEHFTGKVVRKDLTSRVKGNAVVPSYVLEYLLGQYCAVNDEEIIANGIEKVKEIIRNNFVQKSEAEVVKSTIRSQGTYKIIDKVNVTLNERSDSYEATFENLGVTKVFVADHIVTKHQKLLSGGGVWCILQISFDHSDGATNRWIIDSLKPIQVSGVNLDEYREKRTEFTTDEWLDLLMHSIGLNPEHFNRRGKFIQLSRLLTHVENNYNFVELGPKGTGKSHIFSELSPHGVLVSGGDVTSARLFVSNTGRGKVGLVGYWDVVCLDEFEQVVGSKRADGDMVSIMQNYMANKSFNRGKETIQAYASMAFVGNTKHSVPYMLRNSHLFESIPLAYIKGAFLDRIHIYIPGWEVKILKDAMLSDSYGFIVDYLAEILRQLRKYDYSSLLSNYVELDPSYSGRDKTAILKTFSGLVKLIYPHQQMTEQEALELIHFAVEGRKRVKDQLYILDEVFRDSPVNFQYKVKSSGRTVEVETLENLNYGTNRKKYPAQTPESANAEEEPAQPEETAEKPALVLREKEIILQDNQNGISYKSLFGDYLKGATDIVLTDPYIRMIHQFKNLMEFCLMLSEIKEEEDEINLHVITWNDLEHTPQSIDNLEELKESLMDMGINLTYEFQDLHDRSIVANNGWKIKLGRGLDIFEKTNGRFDIAEILQEKRQCRNCEITFVRNG